MKTVLIQILIIILISLLLNVIFKKISLFKNFRVLDVLLPFWLIFIYQLTLNQYHISQLPLILIPWLVVALVALLVLYFTKPRFNLFRYFLIVWRIGDLYFLLMWIIVMIRNLLF